MRSDNFNGFGKVPAFTLRHSVGPLKGKGAGHSGRFELCTSWDSRMNALSGSVSNEGMPAIGLLVSAGMIVAMGVCCALSFSDMICRPLKLTTASLPILPPLAGGVTRRISMLIIPVSASE